MAHELLTLVIEDADPTHPKPMWLRFVDLLRQLFPRGFRVRRLEDAEARIRRETVEKCCAHVCDECRAGYKVVREDNSGGIPEWTHKKTDSLCRAAEIREKTYYLEQKSQLSSS